MLFTRVDRPYPVGGMSVGRTDLQNGTEVNTRWDCTEDSVEKTFPRKLEWRG